MKNHSDNSHKAQSKNPVIHSPEQPKSDAPPKRERQCQYGQIPYNVGFYGYKNQNKKPDIS